MSEPRLCVYHKLPSENDIREYVKALSVADRQGLAKREELQAAEAFSFVGVDRIVSEAMKDVTTQSQIAEKAQKLLCRSFDVKQGCYWEMSLENLQHGVASNLFILRLVVPTISGGRVLFPAHIARTAEDTYSLWEVTDLEGAEAALEEVENGYQ